MAVLFMLTLTAYSQHYVTKFLGIPVDGSKSEMIRKLKAKGFQSTEVDDCLTGKFNGREVMIAVQTNKDKVWRIAVMDTDPSTESNIKIRFNNLCNQFSNNQKYVRFGDQTIPEKESISYEITVNKKQYEASFLQWPSTEESSSLSEEAINNLKDDATKRLVWFTIGQEGIYYKIILFYENGYNQANGEDL